MPRHGWIALHSIHFTEDRTNKLRIKALGDSCQRCKLKVNTCPACNLAEEQFIVQNSPWGLLLLLPEWRAPRVCVRTGMCMCECVHTRACKGISM